MNLLLQLLIATALIAIMIILRVFSYRRALQLRLRCEPGSESCNETECFHGCGGATALRKPGPELGN